MRRKVLVTGSKGFIGKAVLAELKRREIDAVRFDLPRDVRDPFHVEGLAKDCDGIINLAGRLGTHELFGHEADAASVNILGAITVYDVAARLGIPVVQIGTGHRGQPNPYAITKACAEDLGLSRAQWRGEKITVVRAYHVYGPNQLPGAPYGPASVQKFFPSFACAALTGDELELCGGGLQEIDPVYVDDCAVALVDGLSGPYGEVTEAGNGIPFTVEQIAGDIRAAVGVTLSPIAEADQRDGEPKNASVVATRPGCNNIWPYKVAETVEWYREWLRLSRS